MADKIDYNKLGFKAGLEIHQQLDTGKLFCSCPGVLRSDEPLFEVRRKLHPVSGESGEVDVAAEFQHAENKEHVYQVYDTTCLVELDEEPPHKINQEALYVALQIAELLNCKIVPVTQIMRKTVINGSNTSGFQRTVLFARDGYIETSQGRVGIDSLYLEEDSARKIKTEGDLIYWRLDRLGIPLVEISTRPDLKNSEHVKEAALKIGEILRSCRVKRGIGTIRQDLNISIRGSNRVEIKGFQDPKIMEKTVDLEIERQEMYLGFRDLIFSRGEIYDVTDILSPKLSWMKKEIENGSRFIGFKLPSFSGRIGKKNDSDNYWLGKEIAGYAKTRGFGGVIHSDENMEKYGFSEEEISSLKDRMDCKSGDAWLLVLGEKNKSESMIRELIFPFLSGLKDGNPKEVRNCLVDGTTEFIRPMPGASRMYPETDLELLRIHRDLINDVKRNLPKLRSEVEKDLKKEGLNEELLSILFKRDKLEEFKQLFEVVRNPNLVGKVLLLIPKEISVKENLELEKVEEILNVDVLSFVLEKLTSSEIEEGDLKDVLTRVVRGENVVSATKVEKIDLSSVEEFVVKIVKEKPGLRPNAYMGLVMKEFGGKLSASQVMQIIEKLI